MGVDRHGRFHKAVAVIVMLQLSLSATLSLQATGTGPEEIAAHSPHPPVRMNATAQIDSLIRQVDEGLVGSYIQGLQDFKTRYSYRGDRCYPASDYIASVFSRNGLNVSFGEFTYSYYKMRNVIGEKRGVTHPETILIICAHYDSISDYWAWTEAPGADDNGSGTAAVMALAEILSDYEFNCTIRFIGFSGEEQGLKGSYRYVSDAVTAGENISAVINMDMIANNPDPGSTQVHLYTGTSPIAGTDTLINETVNTTVIHAGTIGLEILNAGKSGQSDHHPFAPYYRSIMLAESEFSPVYHSTSDTVDILNLTYCANITQIAGATAARMAGIRPSDVSPPTFSGQSPTPGGYANGQSTICLVVADPGGLNATSFAMTVSGETVAPDIEETSLGYNVSFSPPLPLPDGQTVNVTFSAADLSGNSANTAWNFTVDSVPPQPPTGLTVAAGQIQPVKQETAIDIGTTYDSRYAMRPSVIFHDGEYKMWYTGYDSSKYRICFADSPDGRTWTKHGVVLSNGTVGELDSLHSAYPSVIFDGEYKMWYSGFSNSKWRILYANSSDGITWTKRGLALDVGAPGDADETFAYFPCVLRTSEYEMWYTGLDGLSMHILYANSSDGISWSKRPLEVTPNGPGVVYGDAYVCDPAVAFNGTGYSMYYGRYDGLRMRTMFATSSDGLDWTEIGLAIDTGETPDYDSYRANQCAILLEDNETKIWYSAFNNVNVRIMYANLTDAKEGLDLILTWSKSTSQDVIRYEVFRESAPRFFSGAPEATWPEYYRMPAGVTKWTAETRCVQNMSVCGPVTGSDPNFFYLPDDNILDMDLYLRTETGEWTDLLAGTDYSAVPASGFVRMFTTDFAPGCIIFAWYNCSEGRALRTHGRLMSDSGAGSATDLSYYYLVRAVDRAGNTGLCAEMVGKIGTPTHPDSWNLLCNPFLEAPSAPEREFALLDWSAARTWDPARWPHQWTIARPGATVTEDTLGNITCSNGVWVRIGMENVYSACGRLSNISTNLSPGWNLVSYPYHEAKSVSDALAGVAWDLVEVYEQSGLGMLTELGDNDPLLPGMGLWVHVQSSSVWNAANVP